MVRLVALAAVSLTGPMVAAGADPAADVAALIRLLDHDEFAERREATRRLIEVGDAALPALLAAADSPSPEVRYRVQRALDRIVHRDLVRRFQVLGEQAEAEVDVEEGMWLIARIVDPRADRADLDRRLDELAERVRSRLVEKFGKEAKPAEVPPAEALAAMGHVLFGADGFTGNVRAYDDPRNSSLAHVLQSREGLPILLSHVVVAVGRRVELPIHGLPVPGRYMCFYDATGRKEGAAGSRIIDPFAKGRVMTLGELRAANSALESLAADPARNALSRMLLNLANDYEQAGQPLLADRVQQYRALLGGP